ncbi:signal recognition particle-docking protein FtsY [bacterium]|nr:signal recognition particle-docking protein FtsY [bacterium]
MLGIFGKKLSSIFTNKKLDNATLESLEELLITSDISYDIVENLIQTIKKQKFGKDITDTEIKQILKEELLKLIQPFDTKFEIGNEKPFSIIMIGVNGSGKTTTIGKLCNKYVAEGKSVSVIACDTFRIAATEQLADWVKKAGAKLISKDNANPSGLAYDGYNIAKSQNDDIVFIDTAGRLSNNENLMAELEKIINTVKKINPSAPDKTILVLDGNGGQNSLTQMEKFSQNINIDGFIITKTEGSSKSGFIISLINKYKKPVYFLANGEKAGDIKPFSSSEFIDNLLEL